MRDPALVKAAARDWPEQVAVAIDARDGKVTVLHQGTVLCEGKFDDVQADIKVREVYLGRGKHGTR